MKKRAIEKIPYLTLPDVVKSKKVKYVGVTAFKNIGHERHLFLEVYSNTKKDKDVPVVRIVLTKKDFGNYFPEEQIWTRQKINSDSYFSDGLIWITAGEDARDARKKAKSSVLASENDLDRIKKMCDVTVYDEDRWWQYIYEHEDDITIKARRQTEKRKYERRQNALKDREQNTPELPEKMILDRADKLYFNQKHYLYYKKMGCWADIACSKCGGVSHGRWKKGISYESQFQKWIEEPREGQMGHCPMCGAVGEYKCQGKVKGKHRTYKYLFLGQKYKGTGMVMRYVEVSKSWHLDLLCGEKGTEMHGAYEELSGVEIARAYFSPGENVQIDYHKHSCYTGKDFWDDCNLYGNANIVIKEAPIMSETWENMKETMFQYSAMREYDKSVYRFNPIDYLSRYEEIPQIEMLVKLGLIGVVERLVKYEHGIIIDKTAERPDEFLGIRKQRVRQLMEKKGDVDALKVMQMEYRLGAEWTDEQLEHIAEVNLSIGQIETTTAYMSVQQLLNRIEKYAGCEYGTGCRSAEEKLKTTATIYIDYLVMRRDLGYDMTNTVYLYPKNLERAHTQMVAESNQKKVDERLDEVKIRFPNIRSSYRKLRNKYYYEDETYLIRPARSAEEIVQEGRILHHCVGGNNYLSKHNNGETYILMLRFKEWTEVPYITIEIDAEEERIIQWYGVHDRKPDEKNIQRWLDEYLKKLKAGLLGAGQNMETDEEQQVLIPAM